MKWVYLSLLSIGAASFTYKALDLLYTKVEIQGCKETVFTLIEMQRPVEQADLNMVGPFCTKIINATK